MQRVLALLQEHGCASALHVTGKVEGGGAYQADGAPDVLGGEDDEESGREDTCLNGVDQ